MPGTIVMFMVSKYRLMMSNEFLLNFPLFVRTADKPFQSAPKPYNQLHYILYRKFLLSWIQLHIDCFSHIHKLPVQKKSL